MQRQSLPDFTNLPPDALINVRAVLALCAMCPAVLDRRIRAGLFPAPIYHGRNRLWRYGAVLEWLRSVGPRTGGR